MRQTKLFIAGDSTAASYPPEQAPMAGWGQLLCTLFDARQVLVCNEAKCGRSSRSFIAEGYFDRIRERIGAGDYLFIQFGHNDQKPGGGFTDPSGSYPETLARYAAMARDQGAVPVLLTPVERRHFDAEGRLLETHGDYPEAVRRLARELDVPLIDLCLSSRALYESLGPEASKGLFVWLEPGEHPNYPDGVHDNTHFNERGAREIARLAADGIAAADVPLKHALLPAGHIQTS
ncbi:rhamnogalacturonan acetylesterase [Paenibacillus filicis]|uniref:Rhamnogalacturonan acetylesterase n=1 Tax=Paenibacillus gyeongsangnamensis TaxID=3388067 RepID=A0ABT4Q2G9_9BACL|nr:rhamnogalacturonan acetylesterase [Paenibacillus filicis]MCZ8511083.1 rhamnogalacturonan acetylesterase [Paenibacillus filicis]